MILDDHAQHDHSLKLFVIFSRAYRTISDFVTEDMKSHGLHPTEFMVLELLYHKGDQPIQQIGKKVLLASGSITYVIDKLEARKLVERKLCPEDRRVTFVSLTQEGRERMDMIFPKHQKVIETIFEPLNAEEKNTMATLLKKVGLHVKDLKL